MPNYAIKFSHAIKHVRDQQKAAEELIHLYEQTGELRPEMVVEHARDQQSALHDAFDWDDFEAAHKWRLHQARALIRCVVMVKDQTEPAREVFVHVAENGYHPVDVVIHKPDLYIEALQEALRRFKQAEAAYKRLKDAAENSDNVSKYDIVRIHVVAEALATARAAIAQLH